MTSLTLEPASAMDVPRVRPQTATDFRRDIQGMRAIAVLLVVLFHGAVPGFAGGFVGVDIFFAISGYLIVPHLTAEVERSQRIDLLAFYARRFRRLLPGAAAMIVVTLILGMLLASGFEQTRYLGAAVATAVYASNLWFLFRSGDYFSADTESNPFLHTWSLAVEEQFYIVIPILIVLAYKLNRRYGVHAVLIAASLVTYVVCVRISATDATTAFYSPVTRVWEFGAGALAGLLDGHWRNARKGTAEVLGWTGFLLVMVSATMFLTKQSVFPGYLATIPIAGSVAMLVSGRIRPDSAMARAFSAAPLQWFGERSYSLYLWHWPLLVFAGKLFPDGGLGVRAGAIALSVMLGAASYTLIENPARFHGGFQKSKRLTIGLAMLTTVALALAALTARYVAGRAAQSPAEAGAVLANSEAPPANCTLVPDAPVRPVSCAFGDRGAKRTVVLFGDSHAEQWLKPLSDLFRREHYRLVVMARYSCPIPDLPAVYVSTSRKHVPECPAWRQAAMRQIAAMRPDAVIVATSQHYVRAPERQFAGVGADAVGQIAQPVWQQALGRTLHGLRVASPHVVYLRDTPRPPFDVPTCVTRGGLPISWARSRCEIAARSALPASLWVVEQRAAQAAGALPVDVTGMLCNGRDCPATIDGVVAYRDGSHLSARMSERMEPELEKALAPLFGKS